jgi:NTE family protein
MPDLGDHVAVHHLTTPDLGTGMIDFSRTADHLELGRRAAAELLEDLHAAEAAAIAPSDPTDPSRPPRFWDRFNRAA